MVEESDICVNLSFFERARIADLQDWLMGR